MPATPQDLEKIVLALAAEEARRYGDGAIGAEHLLLALVRCAADDPVLRVFKLNEEEVRSRIEEIIGPRSHVDHRDPLPLLSCARAVLDNGYQLARRSRTPLSAADLLAVLAAHKAFPHSVLSAFRVTWLRVEQARQELRDGASVETARQRVVPPGPFDFALPFASDPYVAATVEKLVAGDKEKRLLVNAGRFDEAFQLRDRLAEELEALRRYCSERS